MLFYICPKPTEYKTPTRNQNVNCGVFCSGCFWWIIIHSMTISHCLYNVDPQPSTPILIILSLPDFLLPGPWPVHWVIFHCSWVCLYSNLRPLLTSLHTNEWPCEPHKCVTLGRIFLAALLVCARMTGQQSSIWDLDCILSWPSSIFHKAYPTWPLGWIQELLNQWRVCPRGEGLGYHLI